NRRTLVSVPRAYAAAAGGPLYQYLTHSPEAGRKISPAPTEPVLAARPRDYSLMVRKDPFNGPLKDVIVIKPKDDELKFEQPKDLVVKQNEKPSPVRLWLDGPGADKVKIRAVAAGTLYPEGELTVDERGQKIELPMTSAAEGNATVTVSVTPPDGGEPIKREFKVSVEATIDSRPDVSAFVRLTMLSLDRTDGSAFVRIFDSANQQRYDVNIRGEAAVTKELFVPTKNNPPLKFIWAADPDYKHPPGVLVVSDKSVRTNRTFKVVGADLTGLLLLEAGDPSAAPKPGGKGGPPSKGPGGPGGGNRQSRVASAITGAAAVVVNTLAPPAPPPGKVYRWAVGQSLAALTELPKDEADKVLKRAAAGPVVMMSELGGQ
ncbi:MAG: hypothetical protein K2V38_08105, partial [Gemmataceae bacterium]|nr:hypothetical protein [Gemmataceae bacterium]